MTEHESPSMLAAALWYANRGIFVFPAHEPRFDADGNLTGCTCEEYRRSDECKTKHPHLYLGPDGHCANPGKCPRLRWREKSTNDPITIRQWWTWWPSANIGVDCGKSGLVLVDADLYKDTFDADLSQLDAETVTSITGGGGEHLWYRQPEGCHYGNDTGSLPAGLDIRGEGGYVIAPPSLHKSGARYRFEIGYALHEVPVAPLPPIIRQQIDGGGSGTARRWDIETDSEAVQKAMATVKRTLSAGSLDYSGPFAWGDGVRFILTKCPFNPSDDPHADKGDDAVVTVAPDGSIGAMCQHARCQKRIQNEAPQTLDGTPSAWAWIKLMAGITSPVLTTPATPSLNGNGAHHIASEPVPEPASPDSLTDRLNSLGANDQGNADALMLLHGKRFLHCNAFGWLTWTGTHWNAETGEKALTRAIMDTLARRVEAAARLLREEATQALGKRIMAAAMPSAPHARNCAYLLPSMLSAEAADFDSASHLLNVANGVVDLRSKHLLPHNPAQRFSYCIPIPYEPGADSSGWTRFLVESIEGGVEALDCIQASMGYWLTGETSEEKLWYLYGATRAGKGVMMETMQSTLGPKLFGTAQFNTFTKDRSGDDQGFDLAALSSARVVFAEESNRQDYLNPGRIKSWTGGGSITCARKNRDPFTYRVQWKGVLASNHPVNSDATDDALWGRLQVWHFPHSHLGHEDFTLKDRMRRPEFLKGVLAWCVEGAARWYELLPHGGIASITPAAMNARKEERRDELDLVGRWLEENCTEFPGLWTSNATLYEDFTKFCQDSGQKPYSIVTWAMSLSKRGFESVRRRTRGRIGRGFSGIGLITDELEGVHA